MSLLEGLTTRVVLINIIKYNEIVSKWLHIYQTQGIMVNEL